MDQEQQERFSTMRALWSAASEALTKMEHALHTGLQSVDHDSSQQAADLQRIQEQAGKAVDALRQVSELARHARSYQAQIHQRHSGRVPH
ncbi:hypothetical protein [Alicyclobacillus kakegawensis]|uniref:hypothetical protein n=1 Tax=Alicyclobacillus kakegawensis TaxID=392012 RepID=UPI000831659A|nr:hypothetical protein [Alicyclobacillus kakegawensis]